MTHYGIKEEILRNVLLILLLIYFLWKEGIIKIDNHFKLNKDILLDYKSVILY